MSEVQNTENTAAVVDAATADVPSISVADLRNAVEIIDHACLQGAFKGWQVIEQVMAVRNKIAAFVVASTPPEEEKPAPAPKKAAKKAAPAAKKAAPAARTAAKKTK